MQSVDDIPEHELGAAHDQAVDTAIEAKTAEEVLRDMFVRLDGLADSRDLPGDTIERLREHQKRTAELADLMETVGTNADHRAEKIRDRLPEQ